MDQDGLYWQQNINHGGSSIIITGEGVATLIWSLFIALYNYFIILAQINV